MLRRGSREMPVLMTAGDLIRIANFVNNSDMLHAIPEDFVFYVCWEGGLMDVYPKSGQL
jgi:hypothetical protein